MRLFNIFGSKSVHKKEAHPFNDLWSTLFGNKDSSAIKGNIEAFEKISWVFKCTEVVAMKMATVPYSIYIGDGDTVHQKLTELFRNPNNNKTKTEFMLSIETWKLLKGFAVIENQYPYIAVLDSNKVQVREGQLYYGERRLDPKNYAILRNYNYRTGALGLPQISALLPTVKLQSAMEVANKALLDNGAIIPFVLSTDQQLAPATVDELREQIQKNYSGPERAGTVPIFHSGIKPERIGISPLELGIIAQEGVTKARISTVFGVPSIYINDMQNVNYATAKTQQELFIRNTIMPRLTILGEQLENYVIPMFESKRCRIYFDYQSLPELQEDEDKRAERDTKLVQAGIYTINEVRSQRGEEPVAWGNEWWRSYGLTDGTDMIVEPAPAEPAKAISSPNIILSKNMTDNDRAIFWKMYVSKTFSQEKKMESVMRKYFKKQQKYIIDNYTSGTKGFFPVEWNEQLQKILKPLYYAYGEQAIDGMKADYNISFTFDTGSELFASYVKSALEKSSAEIIKTTEEALTKELEESMRTGEAPDAIANRVNKVFDFAEKYRAKRIARTEVNGINNETMYMVATDAGMEKKQWTTSLDEKVRDSHMAVDGLIIGINEQFELAANFGMDYLEKPGDQNASPENRINCRCVATYQ